MPKLQLLKKLDIVVISQILVMVLELLEHFYKDLKNNN